MEAVEILLDKLKELFLHEAHLIKDWRHDLGNLVENLQLVKDFLENSSANKQRSDESHQRLVLQIRDFVYEMDDIIDAYVTQAATTLKSKNFFLKALTRPPPNLLLIDQTFQPLRDQIQKYKDASSCFYSSDVEDRTSLKQQPRNRDNLVVGLEDVKEEVMSCLTEETDELDVITIVGMPGIGKSALAWKTYGDDAVVYEFPTRIWIDVSNEFSQKEIFLAILMHFISLTDDINGRASNELAQLVATYLQRGNFLIVMDDVLSTQDWDRLQFALPKNVKKGKVLITSCNENVGLYASRHRPPLRVRFLTHSESWSLLRWKVFDSHECPQELENIGRLIAEQCEGLPLAILTIARTLVQGNLSSSTMTGSRKVWTKVCSRVPRYIGNIFYLSLPYHLRMCFLYFGMFPPDFKIPVGKLICMWTAEGFIRQRNDMSLEETAELYLTDLIDRNLVIVDKVKSTGKIKSCHIHGMLREYCITEAGKERVLQQIRCMDGESHPPISDLSNYHRLCITSDILDFLSSKPFGPRVRSFVGFSQNKVHLPPHKTSTIPAAFKLLRVLDVPIQFTKIPTDMYQLVHLRFLTLSFDSAILPAAFSKLWNIQTLIVDTTSHTLEIKTDIWQFTQLRHLKTNVCATLAKAGKHGKQGQNLRTLATISPASCTEEVFNRARYLKKLSIRGELSLFFDGSFDCLGKLIFLENLKLLNDVYPLPPSEGRLHSLPPAYKFPPSLRSLTLAYTHLDWSQMSTLASLGRLQVLKLKGRAFIGHSWVTEDGGFDSLEALHIESTDLVIWVASAHHFPRLTSLKLHDCEKLQEVPIELANISTLQWLELYNTKLAAASVIRIQEEIKKHKGEEGRSMKAREFKLSIFHPR